MIMKAYTLKFDLFTRTQRKLLLGTTLVWVFLPYSVLNCTNTTTVIGTVGGRSTLLCDLRPTDSVVQWVRFGKILSNGNDINININGSSRYTILGDETGEFNLMIKGTQMSDVGIYRCDSRVNEYAITCYVNLSVTDTKEESKHDHIGGEGKGFNLYAWIGMFVAVCFLVILITLSLAYIVSKKQEIKDIKTEDKHTEEQSRDIWTSNNGCYADNDNLDLNRLHVETQQTGFTDTSKRNKATGKQSKDTWKVDNGCYAVSNNINLKRQQVENQQTEYVDTTNRDRSTEGQKRTWTVNNGCYTVNDVTNLNLRRLETQQSEDVDITLRSHCVLDNDIQTNPYCDLLNDRNNDPNIYGRIQHTV